LFFSSFIQFQKALILNFKVFLFLVKFCFELFYGFVVCRVNEHTYSNTHLFTNFFWFIYIFAFYIFLNDEKMRKKWVWKVHLNRMKLQTCKMLEELLLFIYSHFVLFNLIFFYRSKIRQCLKTGMQKPPLHTRGSEMWETQHFETRVKIFFPNFWNFAWVSW
jgi:hypothetical protein